MSTILICSETSNEALYRGLRMTADEYFQLEDDGFYYELIDGVVCMSPSPTPLHQKVAARITGQITSYLDTHPIGEVFIEVDVYLRTGSDHDLVYRPDIVFLRSERAVCIEKRINAPPDLVIEIISNTSRRYDNETKKEDYELAGVKEYWIIDPERENIIFYRLQEGHYAQIAPEGDSYKSEAIPGFALDLTRVRKSFHLPG